MGQSNRSHTGQADTIADHAAVPAPMNTNENVPMTSAMSFVTVWLDVVDPRYGIDRSARSGLRQAKPGWLRDSRWRARATAGYGSKHPYSAACAAPRSFAEIPMRVATPMP
jgi:hypothetical protein